MDAAPCYNLSDSMSDALNDIVAAVLGPDALRCRCDRPFLITESWSIFIEPEEDTESIDEWCCSEECARLVIAAKENPRIYWFVPPQQKR